MHTIIIHVTNEDSVMAEVEELPNPSDQFVICINPRKKDGKELFYLMNGVNKMLLPWWRITFIEFMPTGEEEDVFTFVRE